ncbi:trypsin-like peptidase domain-containing protein [Acholeplasma equirhinis]|uniref:S1 family peptidase n=1 Tax=Acholeplasma equirhinis TaxID=555393 RepID=UPI00197A83AB|nr:serine protease [Acholeplasma equirhinis]MBN3490538.1 trypsin-like peptidase domain-containing protein [Acholeplasma equirhinis]
MKKILIILTIILIVFAIDPIFNNFIDTPLAEEVQNDNNETTLIEGSRTVLKIVHTLINEEHYVTKTASAVIMFEDETSYYAITNYHVTFKEDYVTNNLEVTDYLNQTYNAFFVEMNQAQQIISEIFDLALVKFDKKEHELPLPVIRNMSLNNTVLLSAVGYPNGIRTSNTGFYTGLINVSGYSIDLIEHSVEIHPGFSGGGLFDLSGKLVGINVSGVFNEEEFVTGFAIPISKVLEYINLFNK